MKDFAMHDESTALNRHPQFPSLNGFTPIHRAAALERFLGTDVRIYLKRDDVIGVGGGGNKLRKREFLLGEALAQNCDAFLTTGGIQSNHARASAAAAARAGMSAELFLTQAVRFRDDDYQLNGNILLDDLFGAKVHEDPLLAAQNRAQEYARLCLRACVVGLGGSSPTGCLGYASCAREILAQQAQLGIDFDSIVVASGSAGTHAGLLAGLIASDVDNIEVIDFSVLARAPAIGDNTRALVTETLKRLGHSGDFPSEKVVVDDSQLGESYGIPTPMMMDAVRTLARTEGLLLDPVYSGKAFAGLIEAIRSWKWAPGASVLFVMTGGAPGLFAYRTALACM